MSCGCYGYVIHALVVHWLWYSADEYTIPEHGCCILLEPSSVSAPAQRFWGTFRNCSVLKLMYTPPLRSLWHVTVPLVRVEAH